MQHSSGLNTFYASLWTDNSGSPGVELSNAHWNLSTNIQGACCDTLSIAGISGVTLTGGAQYFLVLGPLSLSDTSFNVLMNNNQGVLGDYASSSDGGATWNPLQNITLGTFDVLSIPEPSTILTMGAGLAMLVAIRRRILSRQAR
jgi:hypothetical protein